MAPKTDQKSIDAAIAEVERRDDLWAELWPEIKRGRRAKLSIQALTDFACGRGYEISISTMRRRLLDASVEPRIGHRKKATKR